MDNNPMDQQTPYETQREAEILKLRELSKELGDRTANLVAELEQARADAREVESEVGAEFKKLNAKIESLEAQHRGFDDLKSAILSNLRDTSMRAKVWTVTELHKAEINVQRLTRERDDALAEVDRCRYISDRDGRDYSELHNKHVAAVEALKIAKAGTIHILTGHVYGPDEKLVEFVDGCARCRVEKVLSFEVKT